MSGLGGYRETISTRLNSEADMLRCIALLVFFAGALPGPASAATLAPARKNVLFIVSDDLNCDLGCYGHPLVKSPNIDRLAKRGLRFELAYCQYPVCNPSRSSFLTGLYPEQTGVLTNGGNFRNKVPNVVTLPQLFRKNGYFVARVGKIFHYGVPLQIGTNGKDDPRSWDQVVNPIGIDRTELAKVHTLEKGKYGGTLSWRNVKSKDTDHTDGKGATASIKLLEDHHPDKTGKPFFLAVGFYRPHTPYVAPSHYFDLYPRAKITPVLEKPGDRDDIPVAALADRPKQRELTVPQRKEIIQAYYASISLTDAQVGRVLDALDRLKLAKNTVIVFVSDHGYHLGHHGLWQKGDLFEGSTRVPMIIVEPGTKFAGKSTRHVAEMVSLYPTVCELCGVAKPAHLSGRSLVPVLHDPAKKSGRPAYTVAWSRAARMHRELRGTRILGHSLRTGRYRYTEWAGGKYGVELYDYQTDPQEFTNLAKDPKHAATVKRLKQQLAAARKRGRADPGLGGSEKAMP
jgi:iduronate 2-sulfatase